MKRRNRLPVFWSQAVETGVFCCAHKAPQQSVSRSLRWYMTRFYPNTQEMNRTGRCRNSLLFWRFSFIVEISVLFFGIGLISFREMNAYLHGWSVFSAFPAPFRGRIPMCDIPISEVFLYFSCIVYGTYTFIWEVRFLTAEYAWNGISQSLESREYAA